MKAVCYIFRGQEVIVDDIPNEIVKIILKKDIGAKLPKPKRRFYENEVF